MAQENRRIVFFDIDGTLITFGDKQMPASTKRALEALHKNNTLVYIATGRAYWYAKFIQSYFDFDGFICCNGQFCVDKQEQVYYHKTIHQSTIQEFINYAQENHEIVEFVDDRSRYVVGEAAATSWHEVERITEEELHSKAIMQLNIYNDPQLDQMLMKQFPDCQIVRWAEEFADVYPADGGKQVGIQKVLEHHHVRLEDAVAIGDGGNDVSMLQYVPQSVAMGNATDEVKRNARYVTADIEDDGIYKILTKLKYI